MMNLDLIEIPVNHMEEEEIPLLEPDENASEESQSLFDQIPYVLKVNGFGYYRKPVENEMDLLDDECYASHLANYWFHSCFEHTCSFEDWANRVRSKVGGVRLGTDFDSILVSVKNGNMGMIEAARHLFTRNQLVYYGW